MKENELTIKAKGLLIQGWDTPEGKYREYILKKIEDDGNLGRIIGKVFKKLVDGEWVEISEKDLPEGLIMKPNKTICPDYYKENAQIKEFTDILKTINNENCELEEKLKLISSLLTVCELAARNADMEIDLQLSDVLWETSGKAFEAKDALLKLQDIVFKGIKKLEDIKV